MSTGTPPWSTAITARVLGVSTASIVAGGDVAGQRVDVGEDGVGAHVHDDVRGGDEGEGRDDDVVTRADARDDERELERRRAARHGDGVRGVGRGGEHVARTRRPCGPCATQPDRRTAAAASTSSSPSQGCMTLMRGSVAVADAESSVITVLRRSPIGVVAELALRPSRTARWSPQATGRPVTHLFARSAGRQRNRTSTQ